MRLLRHFYVRLTLLFLGLLLILAAVLVGVSLRIFDRRQVEIDQLVNARLARDMAVEIEPHLQGDTTPRQVGPIIHYMMVLNPAVEIYVLDHTGAILAFFAESGETVVLERVDLAPIRAFLDRGTSFPVYGDDPRRPEQRKPFSVAPIRLSSTETGYLYIILQSSLYDQVRDNLQRQYLGHAMLTSALVALPVVGILGLLVFFLSTRRLKRLTRTVRAFGGAEGSPRAEDKPGDEIGELAASFNQMADTIEANLRTLKKVDTERRDLVAGISHDLRNPLASIRGYTETLMQKEAQLEGEEREKYLRIILNRATVLSRLVEDLFELSKLDAEEAGPAPERFSLSELVQDVLMQLRPAAEQKGIDLSAEEPGSLLLIEADLRLVERLLFNLIDNALNHTPRGGRIKVTLSEEPGRARVAVSDTGCGIAPEHLPRIFDRFYIADESRSRSRSGSGLGLAIARRIVELHGGRISAESVPEEGSTFVFELPAVSGGPAGTGDQNRAATRV